VRWFVRMVGAAMQNVRGTPQVARTTRAFRLRFEVFVVRGAEDEIRQVDSSLHVLDWVPCDYEVSRPRCDRASREEDEQAVSTESIPSASVCAPAVLPRLAWLRLPNAHA